MRLIAITNQSVTACAYERAGVDRILVDLERLGKAERQAGKPSWISDHSLEDVRSVRAALRNDSLMVRINPMNPDSEHEINAIVSEGANVIMLPMAREVSEVRRFVELVAGRARTCLLLETAEALASCDRIVTIEHLDEIHVGLNDLHLALGMRCMFEILADGLLDRLAALTIEAGKVLGIGGVGAIGSGEIDPRLILTEHVRLGSSMVILSRSFFRGTDLSCESQTMKTVGRRIQELRGFLGAVRLSPLHVLAANRAHLQENVARYLTRAPDAHPG